MRWLKKRERPLFRTHEPPFRQPDWAVGQLLPHEGRLYRVSRWVELRPVLLERGGSVGEWEIWGRRVSDRELRRELSGATHKMLAGE
ncbi:MAG: hypothetical protein V1912_10125 [bacterium]